MKTQSLKSLTLYMIAIAMVMALGACKPIDAEETLRRAESQLSFGNIEQAASSCEVLTDSTTALSPTQLCRVAIIYAKISEQTEKEDYMAAAAECLDRAMDIDIDTIDMYIETLDIEDKSYMHTIREVAHAINFPCDISKEDDFDGEEFIHDHEFDDADHHEVTTEKANSGKKTKKAKSAKSKNTAEL